jgi:transcriptional regulator with XRE-family HTH domain
MKDRILAIIKEEELTAAKFAQEIGVQPSSISHIFSGRNKPSIDLITKILSRFPGISADWILQGKGKMYVYQNEKQEELKRNEQVEPDLFNPENKQSFIPKIEKNDILSSSEKPIYRSGNHTSQAIHENPIHSNSKKVEKIIVLYTDKSFTEYHPD